MGLEMTKSNRNRRLVAMAAELMDNPGRVYSLGWFCDRFGIAKSTASEDLTFVNEVVQEDVGGSIITIPGASGGIFYRPGPSKGEGFDVLGQVAAELKSPQRRLPGGFLFYSDLLFNPAITARLGRIFAGIYGSSSPNQVLTLETKGIPLALFTAYYLNCPLLIARRSNKISEGPSVSTNYLTGSGKRIETMFLPKRSLPRGSQVLIIDDFMKAGGSARGLEQLAIEFDSEVAGIGVLISTAEPQQKLVESYTALLRMGPEDYQIKVAWEENLS